MPSAEMRRNTRIFEARVLRSGRRVSTGSRKEKHMKTKVVSEWIDLLDDSGDDGDDATYQVKGWHRKDSVRQQKVNPMDIDRKMETKLEVPMHENLIVEHDRSRMFGIVYTRKRKKLNSDVVNVSSVGGETTRFVDKRYQKHYVRQRWRKKIRLSEATNICDSNVTPVTRESHLKACREALVIVVRPWCSSMYFVSGVLTSALRYMRKARIGLDQLVGFFLSKTFSNVCSSCGIDFMQVIGSLPKRGLCILSEASIVPMFYVDFSAVPSCFMYLHSCLQLRFASIVLIIRDEILLGEEEEIDDRITAVCIPLEKDQVTDIVPIVKDFTEPPVLESHSDFHAAKLSGRTMQLRNARIKTANSLRPKRGRPPSMLRVRKYNDTITSKSPDRRRDSRSLYRARCVAKRNISSSVRQVKSAVVGFNRAVDPTSCTANMLIMESQKCYREEGVTITLEVSAVKRWHLAIKKNGVLQYSLIAQNIMRPCTCNRYTRAIILNIENGWKLEFTDRLQWSVFKELYKQCSDRNMQVPLESSIPIPGVTEVPVDLNSNSYFVRPVSYINVNNDELTRALMRKAANYDMDSDDEEWLNKFNADTVSEDASHNLLSHEDFELIIDAFERGSHCNPDDYSDESAVPNISLNVVPRIVEAVYAYWFKKRKQKKAALVRVFQLYQPRRSQFIPRSVLRKKRSFKRQRVQTGLRDQTGQRVQTGRGKQPTLLEALAAEQDAAQDHLNAVLRVEETKAAAKRSESVAILKRQRAQQLMENADLATYKAVMALRIAELAQFAESAGAEGDGSS